MFNEARIESQVAQRILEKARQTGWRITSVGRPFGDGWQLAPYDPTQMLSSFSHIRLRPGYKLASYQFFGGDKANGFVFVIPDGCELPPPPSERLPFHWVPYGPPVIDIQSAGLPDWVRSDVGGFLDGDGTPLSYFEASIFSREVRELDAFWHGCSWSMHALLLSRPLAGSRDCSSLETKLDDGCSVVGDVLVCEDRSECWSWLETEPDDWRPVVRRLPEGSVSVEFYSQTSLGRHRMIRHTDLFTEGYQPQSQEQTIAEGEGYIEF